MRLRYADMAERIEVLLGVETLQGTNCIRWESRFPPTDSMRPSSKLLWPLVLVVKALFSSIIYSPQSAAADQNAVRR